MRFVNGFHQLRKSREPGYVDLIAWGLAAVAVLGIVAGWW